MTDNLFSVEDIPRRWFLEPGIREGIAPAAARTLRIKTLQIGGE